MDKNIFELKVEEKDGEYTIRIKGDKAGHFVKHLPMFCCCCSSGKEGKGKADADCC